jgi:hypothetical protein
MKIFKLVMDGLISVWILVYYVITETQGVGFPPCLFVLQYHVNVQYIYSIKDCPGVVSPMDQQ